jgi:4'-phosphopantetheinyl transferase EntD
MNSQILGLKVAGFVFGLMCLAQLLRLVIRPQVLIAGHHLPLWPSGLAFVILGSLSLWMWKLARARAQ